METFIPLGDRVLIRPIVPELKTKGGLFMAENCSTVTPIKGEVIAVGSGRRDANAAFNGIVPMIVKVGDIVTWGKFAGAEITLNEEKFLLIHEAELVGIFRTAINVEELPDCSSGPIEMRTVDATITKDITIVCGCQLQKANLHDATCRCAECLDHENK